MASLLEQLPLEILQNTTHYLTTPEYGNVRLLCKSLESKTFDFWAKEFFAIRQFGAISLSLQALVSMSKQAALAPYVRKLIMTPLGPFFQDDSDGTRFWENEEFRNIKDDEIFDDLVHFISTGKCYSMLLEALRNFKNCSVIELRNYHSTWKGGRTRDSTSWKWYGANTFASMMDVHSDHRALRGPVYPHQLSRGFRQLISAAANAQMRPTEIIAHFSTRSGLDGDAFQIPISEKSAYAECLARVEHLKLDIRYLDNGMLRNRNNLCHFMVLMPMLKSIRLNFCSSDMAVHSLLNFGTAGGAVDGNRTISIALPTLSVVELGFARTTHDILLDLLLQFHGVSSITLHRIDLIVGSWNSLLHSLSKKTNTIFDRLKSFRIMHARQGFSQENKDNRARVGIKDEGVDVATFDDPAIKSDIVIDDSVDLARKLEQIIPNIVVDNYEFRKACGLIESPGLNENEDVISSPESFSEEEVTDSESV